MLSTKEAAAELGVPLGTMKRWVDELPIPLERDAAGARRFGPEALEVLRAIHKLRQDERHFDSIRVILGPIQGEARPGPGLPLDRSGSELARGRDRDPGPGQPGGEEAAAISGSIPARADEAPGPGQPGAGSDLDRAQPGPALEEVAASVGEAIAARMTDEIVQVLRRETDLAEKYARAAHRIGDLEATVRARDERLEAMGAELAEARQRIMLLEAPKDAPMPRPWWKFWG